MAQVQIWLSRFLERRELPGPDGRHLYAYRTSDEEFSELREIVGVAARRRDFPRDKATAALFCLYASEWLRRELEGKRWNHWKPIFDSLGAPNATFDARTRAVERGYDYWKLQIQRQEFRTAYFGSLVCEGGLPLQLLRSEGSDRLRRFFRALLEDAAIFGGTSDALLRSAERHQEILPALWRSPAVFTMAGELVARIRELQRVVIGVANPVAALDEGRPAWRSELPLQLSDGATEALIAGLVEDAAEVAARPGQLLRVGRQLVPRSEGVYAVFRRIAMPRWIEERALAQLFDAHELPERLNLSVETADGGQAFPIAMATKQADAVGRSGFLLEGDPEPRLPAQFAAEAVQLVGRGDGLRFGPAELPGGKAASDLPWTFVEREGRWTSFAEGSTSTSRPEARIVVAPGTSVHAVEGSVEPFGKAADDGRMCFRITGSVLVQGEDWRCRIRTSSEDEDDTGFRLVGPKAVKAFAAGAYLGQPRLLGGVASSALEWRPRGAKGWRRWSPDCVGEVEVRLVVADELRFYDRARVLPLTSRIELEPGEGPSGRIRLHGMGAQEIGVRPMEGVEQRIEGNGDDATVILECSGQPPGQVGLEVRWPGGRRLGLSLPYPVFGGRFLDRNGQVLPNDEQVHVGRLSGFVAHALLPKIGIDFALDLTLEGRHDDLELVRRLGDYIEVPRSTVDATLELVTLQDRLELALAMSKDLDACVGLRLHNVNGPRMPAPKLRVGRYDLHFAPDRETRSLRLAGHESEAASRLRVELRSLLDLQAEPVELGTAEDGVWRLAPLPAGPWWVLGWDGGWCRTRPLLWTEHGPIETLEGTLRAALMAYPERMRHAALDATIARLVEEPQHEEWAEIDACLALAGHVPATAFDLLDRLIESPEAVVTALLRAGDDERRFEQVWDALQQLPFSWHLVPAAAWARATRRWWETLREQIAQIPEEFRDAAEEAQRKAFGRWVDRLRGRLQGIGQVFDRVETSLGLSIPRQSSDPPLPEAFLLATRRDEAAELARTNRQFPTNAAPRRVVIEEARKAAVSLPASIWEDAPLGAMYRQAVLDGPVAAALASALGLSFPRADVYDLRRLQAFDPKWFEFAYATTFSIAFTWTLRTAPERLA